MRLATIAVLCAACWSGTPSQRAAARDVAPRTPFPLRSQWAGTYRCTQGATAVVLDLIAQPDGTLDATFTFGPTQDNPRVANGTYHLSGTIRGFAEGAFQIELRPERWIGPGPDGYVMTPLSATSSRRWSRMRGRIDHPACGELDVRRAD